MKHGRSRRLQIRALRSTGEESDYDLIILATGFRTVEFMHPMRITGSAGRSISDIWAKGGRALHGITVESLPNFGMLYGPNTILAHNSIIIMIEAQSKDICALRAEVLRARQAGKSLTIAPEKEKLDEYNDEVQKKLSTSTFAIPAVVRGTRMRKGLSRTIGLGQ